MASPLRVHPENPHYLMFKDGLKVLITSAEHYGAVVNKSFDYVPYLEKLAAFGLNATRIYPGMLIEPVDKFIPGNTLGLRPEDVIVPWARSWAPGCALGGNKFDLDRWDPAYFRRLEDFISKAEKLDIVVEICFFNAQYPDTWLLCPLHAGNNIQKIGERDHRFAQTVDDPGLLGRELDYVRKIVTEVNGHDNIILEICDEPTLEGTTGAEATAWIGRVVDCVIETERGLPKKHLIAQQLEKAVDFTADPRIPVIVGQYVGHAGAQIGGIEALDTEYHHAKPIELNETSYYPVWYNGDKIAASRAEAWEFIAGGGASFNQLNGLFTAADPAGDTEENRLLLNGLKSLRSFIESFDLVKMRQDKKVVKSGIPAGAFCRAISEPGRQYALYLHHSKYGEKDISYTADPGTCQEDLALDLPPGSYTADWIDPATAGVIRSDSVDHPGGIAALKTPEYVFDLALRIRSRGGRL